MTRDELILRTRQLIAEGDRLDADPSLTSLQTWLQLSDDLLATAWGTMDRYHLAWLMVGKPKAIVRGRTLTVDEEAVYVREVATAKTAALRMSLDAVDRQRMPFRGETGGIGAGQGMGRMPNAGTAGAGAAEAAAGDGAEARLVDNGGDAGAYAQAGTTAGADADAEAAASAAGPGGRVRETDANAGPTATRPGPSRNRQIPLDPELAARLDEVRRAAAGHEAHGQVAPATPAQRRAPRPDRLQH